MVLWFLDFVYLNTGEAKVRQPMVFVGSVLILELTDPALGFGFERLNCITLDFKASNFLIQFKRDK